MKDFKDVNIDVWLQAIEKYTNRPISNLNMYYHKDRNFLMIESVFEDGTKSHFIYIFNGLLNFGKYVSIYNLYEIDPEYWPLKSKSFGRNI